MNWKQRALDLLKDSLEPVPSELNEIDWKSGLSDKTDRLAQHISAFANHLLGGILVYGVNNDGTVFSLDKEKIDDIVKTLGNIASNNLSHRIQIEHTVQNMAERIFCLFSYRKKKKSLSICVVKIFMRRSIAREDRLLRCLQNRCRCLLRSRWEYLLKKMQPLTALLRMKFSVFWTIGRCIIF